MKAGESKGGLKDQGGKPELEVGGRMAEREHGRWTRVTCELDL